MPVPERTHDDSAPDSTEASPGTSAASAGSGAFALDLAPSATLTPGGSTANRLPQRYRLIEEVGQGGMAVVYRARDEKLRRDVAVKVLHAHLLTEAESKSRLEREAQAVAKLKHDNIVQIYDYSGRDSAASFIVTEFIEGKTLKQNLAQRRLPFPELAALLVTEVGVALQHAHDLGILHRDLKPENVMVRNDGLVKLMDFGVAQVVDLERMTVTGQLLGSPAYMAPEMIEGKPVDFRTDVFSLGIMLYQLVTGALPFSGRNPHEVFKRIAEGRFADPRGLNPLVSSDLHKILARALAHRPDDRYATARALTTDLRVYTEAAGLTDPREELRRYFSSNGDTYEKDARPRIAAALLASAQRARTARRPARALELLNRALAIAPHDPAIGAELHRIEGRRRWIRSAEWAGVAAGIAVVGLVAAKLGPRVFREPTPLDVAPPSPAAALKPAPTAVSSPAPPKHTGSAQRVGEPAGARPRGSRAATAVRHGGAPLVVFRLSPTPQKVDIYLDDTNIGAFDVGHDTVSIPWDCEHRLTFRNDACCYPETVELGPERARPDGDVIARKLKWKNASLTLDTEPRRDDVRFLVSERRPGGQSWVAVPGRSFLIRFDPAEEISKSLDVTADLGNGVMKSQVLDVRAGEKRHATIAVSD